MNDINEAQGMILPPRASEIVNENQKDYLI